MELLIRVVDKSTVENASQRGDVISACSDGWAWSLAERSNPDWIIVQVGLTEVEVGALMEPSRSGEPVYRRRLGVNPEGLSSGSVLTRDELMARLF